MKSHISILAAGGVLVQLLALLSFCWLAKVAPETQLKLIGFCVLGVGTWLILRRLFLLPKYIVLSVLGLLSCAAPIVLAGVALFFPGLAKDVDVLSAERIVVLCGVAGLALVCYLLTWCVWHLVRLMFAKSS